MIRFVSYLLKVGGSLRVLRLPPPVKTDRRYMTEILLKVALNPNQTNKQTKNNTILYVLDLSLYRKQQSVYSTPSPILFCTKKKQHSVYSRPFPILLCTKKYNIAYVLYHNSRYSSVKNNNIVYVLDHFPQYPSVQKTTYCTF